MKAGEIVGVLRRHYQADGEMARTVAIAEARSGAGFAGNSGQCDLLVIGAWQSTRHEIDGHEIKVTLQDLRRELERPDKAERFARYCHRWWLVMPQALWAQLRGRPAMQLFYLAEPDPVVIPPAMPSIPDGWGVKVVSENGSIRTVIQADVRVPDPVPVWLWIGWMSQLDRQRWVLRQSAESARNLAIRYRDAATIAETLCRWPFWGIRRSLQPAGLPYRA